MPKPIRSNYRMCPECGKPFPAWRIANLKEALATVVKRAPAPDYVRHDERLCRPCQRAQAA